MQDLQERTNGAERRDASACSLAISFVRIVTDYCALRGVSARVLMAVCDKDEQILADPDARMTYPDFLKICEYAANVLGEDDLGLRVGQLMKPSYLGPYGFALISSSTPKDLLSQALRYSVLAIDVGHNVFEHRGDEMVRYWRNPFSASIAASRILDDLVMSSWLVMVRLISGQPEIVPRWASFAHPAPDDLSPYEALFRCPIKFGAKEYAMGFDSAFLHMELNQGHPEVLASMNALCEQLLVKLATPSEPKWLTECRRLIVENLRLGVPELAEVSKALGIAPATLRMRLSKRSTTFRQLVEDIRHELALSYLKDPLLSLLDIAYLLGFSEQSAFQRAFKRRTALTPGQHRKQMAQV
jgi:AraC-like DNA-binding protein